MKKFLMYVFITMVITGCSENRLNKLPENATIVAFGDSLTYGYGASIETSYPAILESKTNIRVIKKG